MARAVRPLKVEGPWEIVAVEIVGESVDFSSMLAQLACRSDWNQVFIFLYWKPGPFPTTGHGGNTHVVIIRDYYSKWVEAFPVQKKDALCVARCISSSVYR